MSVKYEPSISVKYCSKAESKELILQSGCTHIHTQNPREKERRVGQGAESIQAQLNVSFYKRQVLCLIPPEQRGRNAITAPPDFLRFCSECEPNTRSAYSRCQKIPHYPLLVHDTMDCLISHGYDEIYIQNGKCGIVS